MCVCSLNYPACKSNASYYDLICSLSASTIFFNITSWKIRLSERVIEHKMCVLSFSTSLSETFPILRRIYRESIVNVNSSACKVAVILLQLQLNLNFLHRFIPNISNFMKICPVGAELFHADGKKMEGRVGMTKITRTYRNFTNAPTKRFRNLFLYELHQ